MRTNRAPELGEMLRRHRIAAGLTQEELAERASVSARALSDLERGLHRTAHHGTVQRLASALNLNAAELGEISSAARRPPLSSRTSSASRPGSIPLGLTTFVGRSREVAAVVQRLGMTRLLTLTGVGGMGKTRLALQVARGMTGDYSDGIYAVELAALVDASLVARAVALALGVPEQPGRSAQDVLADAVGSRQVLIVLDNCEHLVEACATLSEALLRTCPRLRILATSRQPLGVAGEATWRVPALSESEAAQLFVERAHAVDERWELTASNAVAVAQVCHRLDGIPLAIELAAARVTVLTPEQIAARLDDRLRLLTGGRRTSPPRQRTLRATLDWSYGLLTADEQRLFNRLSVFAGGWTLEAAEKVGSGVGVALQGDTLDLLARLVDQSLVVAEQSGDRMVRYRLLETLREYGTERLTGSGEADVIRDLHAAYFVAFTERTELELFGGQGTAAQARLEREHDNLRMALRWLVDRCDAESAQRLAGNMGRFWFYGDYLDEGASWLEQVLALPSSNAETGRAKSLYAAGTIDMARGRYAAAESTLREALGLWRALGNGAEEAYALFVLGMVTRQRGELGMARSMFEEGLAVSQASGTVPAEANNLAGLADMDLESGVLGAAQARAEEALERATSVGWRRGMVHALRVLGDIQYQTGDYATATQLMEASLVRSRELGAQFLVAWTLARLGLLAIERGDMAAAEKLLSESMSVCRDIGDRQGVARALEGYAHLAVVQAQPAMALSLVGTATALREAIGGPLAPRERAHLEQRLEPARLELGAVASTTALAIGRAMSVSEALASRVQSKAR